MRLGGFDSVVGCAGRSQRRSDVTGPLREPVERTDVRLRHRMAARWMRDRCCSARFASDVGVLRRRTKPIVLDHDARHFLDALAYYAALGVERVRLTAAAERAEAFRQADELKTALLATVSHDLRTPLTTIKALAHQLAARGEEDALSIEEEADRLNRLVADLLDLSRLSAGALPLRIELDAVDDLVATALDRLRGTRRRVPFACRALDHDEPTSRSCSPDSTWRSRSARSSTCSRTRSSTRRRTEPIELWIARVGDRVRLTVADRGPGVPESERALIFEPFYRPKGARPDVGGAGLGLAIARRVAEAQGGCAHVRAATRAAGAIPLRAACRHRLRGWPTFTIFLCPSSPDLCALLARRGERTVTTGACTGVRRLTSRRASSTLSRCARQTREATMMRLYRNRRRARRGTIRRHPPGEAFLVVEHEFEGGPFDGRRMTGLAYTDDLHVVPLGRRHDHAPRRRAAGTARARHLSLPRAYDCLRTLERVHVYRWRDRVASPAADVEAAVSSPTAARSRRTTPRTDRARRRRPDCADRWGPACTPRRRGCATLPPRSGTSNDGTTTSCVGAGSRSRKSRSAPLVTSMQSGERLASVQPSTFT